MEHIESNFPSILARFVTTFHEFFRSSIKELVQLTKNCNFQFHGFSRVDPQMVQMDIITNRKYNNRRRS